jgi:uncharacterized membrane protein YhaH (DUF805 family)
VAKQVNLESIYISFSGRINRRTFLLANIPVAVFGITINYAITKLNISEIVSYVIDALLFCVTSPIIVKRWHDLGKSAWYLVACFIPIINLITVIELFFAAGEGNPNEYGEPPSAT